MTTIGDVNNCLFSPIVAPDVSSDGEYGDFVLDERPGTMEVPLAPPNLKITGVVFPDGREQHGTGNIAQVTAGASREPADPRAQHRRGHAESQPTTRTRIRPPQDVIKLADRLHYLLQPPLESLLATDSLHFPHQPFPFQLEGIAFLVARREAVLADEMGLGKTMQAITTIRLLAKLGTIRRVLLVCPKPVMTNWRRELALWAPELPVAIIAGNQERRAWQWRRGDSGVTIANYEVIVRDQDLLCDGAMNEAPPSIENERQNDRGQHFDLVVLDEAQRIKNRSGATGQAICSLSRDRSWALTGTPIENSIDDLVGIFEFVSPRLIGPSMRPRTMAKAIRDHLLRRTKNNVLSDLPPRLDRDAVVSLTPEQAESYTLAEEEGVVRLSSMGRNLAIQHVFELILRLKQICNFDSATGASAKLEQLEVDLEECASSGQKAIIFSQWVKSLDELQERLARFGPAAYHGRISQQQREMAIDRFRNDPECQVLLISYGAGSVGLNLQFASYVFLFDRWWNPAVEDQAINRAHRIGSAGPVTVTRFLTAGTIEERIEQILAEKRELFATMFDNGSPGAKIGLSQDEVLGLLGLGKHGNAKSAA